MSDNYKPYWQRHPIQLRVTAILMLIGSPVFVPLVLLFAHWSDIREEFADSFKGIWKIASAPMQPRKDK